MPINPVTQSTESVYTTDEIDAKLAELPNGGGSNPTVVYLANKAAYDALAPKVSGTLYGWGA